MPAAPSQAPRAFVVFMSVFGSSMQDAASRSRSFTLRAFLSFLGTESHAKHSSPRIRAFRESLQQFAGSVGGRASEPTPGRTSRRDFDGQSEAERTSRHSATTGGVSVDAWAPRDRPAARVVPHACRSLAKAPAEAGQWVASSANEALVARVYSSC